MAFQVIVRRNFGSSMPDNILRVSKSSMSVSENISERFQAGRKVMDSGRETCKLGLAVDVEAKKIQLIANPVNGFVFTSPPKGKTLTIQQPRNFKSMGMPTGDYVLEDNEALIFALAQ